MKIRLPLQRGFAITGTVFAIGLLTLLVAVPLTVRMAQQTQIFSPGAASIDPVTDNAFADPLTDKGLILRSCEEAKTKMSCDEEFTRCEWVSWTQSAESCAQADNFYFPCGSPYNYGCKEIEICGGQTHFDRLCSERRCDYTACNNPLATCYGSSCCDSTYYNTCRNSACSSLVGCYLIKKECVPDSSVGYCRSKPPIGKGSGMYKRRPPGLPTPPPEPGSCSNPSGWCCNCAYGELQGANGPGVCVHNDGRSSYQENRPHCAPEPQDPPDPPDSGSLGCGDSCNSPDQCPTGWECKDVVPGEGNECWSEAQCGGKAEEIRVSGRVTGCDGKYEKGVEIKLLKKGTGNDIADRDKTDSTGDDKFHLEAGGKWTQDGSSTYQKYFRVVAPVGYVATGRDATEESNFHLARTSGALRTSGYQSGYDFKADNCAGASGVYGQLRGSNLSPVKGAANGKDKVTLRASSIGPEGQVVSSEITYRKTSCVSNDSKCWKSLDDKDGSGNHSATFTCSASVETTYEALLYVRGIEANCSDWPSSPHPGCGKDGKRGPSVIWTCYPAPIYHRECKNNACVAVEGKGADKCKIDKDCLSAVKTKVTIKAQGRKYTKEGDEYAWPRMQLLVKDNVVETWTVDKRSYSNYTHDVSGSVDPSDIKVKFINDRGQRNLRVDYMKLGSKTYQTEASTTYSTGTWTRGDGCSDDYKESEWLKCNGYFHYMARSSRSSSSTNNVPDGSGYSNGGDDSSTTQIQIKARGRKDDGWPLMDLLVNDVLVKRWEVKSTGSKTYTHEVSGSPKASDIKVRFPNDKKKRDLRVEYIKLDGKKYKTRDTDTYSTGLYDKGCQKAYYDKDYGKEFEWLRCNGYFHFEAPSGQGGGSGSNSSGSPSASGNLILNGDFEAGGSNWNFVGSSSKNRVFTPSGSGIGGGQAAVVSIGKKTKELLLNQAGFQLKPKTKYKLTFYAKSNRKNARFRAYIHENVGKDWDDKDYSYGVRKTSAKLNTDWKKFTKTFTTPKESDSGDKSLPNPMLTFEFDNYEKVGDGYWIDNVILEER